MMVMLWSQSPVHRSDLFSCQIVSALYPTHRPKCRCALYNRASGASFLPTVSSEWEWHRSERSWELTNIQPNDTTHNTPQVHGVLVEGNVVIASFVLFCGQCQSSNLCWRSLPWTTTDDDLQTVVVSHPPPTIDPRVDISKSVLRKASTTNSRRTLQTPQNKSLPQMTRYWLNHYLTASGDFEPPKDSKRHKNNFSRDDWLTDRFTTTAATVVYAVRLREK